MPRHLLLVVLAALAACSAAVTPAPSPTNLPDDQIQLLHTDDIHGHLDADIVPGPNASAAFRAGGLAQLAGQVAGDTWQGTFITGVVKGANVIYGDVEVHVVAAYIGARSPVSPKVEGRLAQQP